MLWQSELRITLTECGSATHLYILTQTIKLPVTLRITSRTEQKKNFISGKCEDVANNPSNRNFWSLAKEIKQNFTTSSFPPLVKPDGSVATSAVDKASIFAAQFALNSTLDESNLPQPDLMPLSEPAMPELRISWHKLRKVLDSLDTDKAYGLDGVPPRVLKNCAAELAPSLHRLFKLILKTNIFPSSWKVAVTQPVPKKGDPADPRTTEALP